VPISDSPKSARRSGGSRLAFAANATFGVGGQGEFLRLMAFALAGEPGATIYSRFVPPSQVGVVNLPFAGTARARACHVLASVPGLRGRQDWLTLLADLDFDSRVARVIEPPALFDGVMAQCCTTVARLAGSSTRVVVTSLNTHIQHLARTLEEEHRRVGSGARAFVHPRMVARALREIAAADHIRVNSELAKRTFVDAGVAESRVTAIHPGVDLDHFRPAPKQDAIFRVIAVSSIDPRKGVHDLLQAFEEARLPNAELVIVGGTGDRWSRGMLRTYRSRHANIVCCAVDITTAPSAGIFGPASVLVHAAVEDGYGLVVPQALASGRPVIVTRTSGASELVEDGRNGFVVDARSPSSIADRLRLLAHDPALWERLCAASRPSVEHLSYAGFASAVQAFYRRVLGE
jgi:glycosyltransferase involved in cell wall biosynthesis